MTAVKTRESGKLS